jgi:hypothetical protein
VNASLLVKTIVSDMLKEISDPLVSVDLISLKAGRVLNNFDAASAIKYYSFQRHMQLPKEIKSALNKL